VRRASPALLVIVAVVAAVYSFATPGVNAPNVAGAPSVSDSVAGTVPPTGAGTLVDGVSGCESSPGAQARGW
jgi:hypothetical protein